jgi:hypothetical protein
MLIVLQHDLAVDNNHMNAIGLLNEPRLVPRQVIHGLSLSTTDTLWVENDYIRSQAGL